MTFSRTDFAGCKLLAVTAIAFAMLTTASQAYTPEQEQMCTGDAMRLCSSEIPNVDRITACMIRQRACSATAARRCSRRSRRRQPPRP